MPFAVRSVLEQTFEDFELVISNGGSTDETSEVVRTFDDPRIKYIESDRRLLVGENYQQGLESATGEYITFLSDDDAFVPQMLETVHQNLTEYEIEVIAFKSCFYFENPTRTSGHSLPGNSLMIQPFTGKVFEFDRSTASAAVFSHFNLGNGSTENFNVSYLANAVYHRGVFSKIWSVNDKPFSMIPADGYLAAAVTYVVEKYHCLDQPLHVWTNWAENATASPERVKNGLRRHYEQLLDGKTLDRVPVKFAMPQNCIANALIQANVDFDSSNEYSDWLAYYCSIFDELMHLKSLGIEIDKELSEFFSVVDHESDDLMARVLDSVQRSQRTLKNLLLRFSPRVFNAVKVVNSLRQRGEVDCYIGKRERFQNVFECAHFAGQLQEKARVAKVGRFIESNRRQTI